MAEQQTVAKWGFPGTPLLPRWFYELLGDKSELISWDGKSITIADLEGTFAAAAKPISKSNEEALSHFVSKRIQTANTDLTQTVLCSWGQLAELIDSLPVRTRTRNQIKYRLKRLENLNQFRPQAPFSVEDCYAIPNLGVKSVLDLSCVLQLVCGHSPLGGPIAETTAMIQPSNPQIFSTDACNFQDASAARTFATSTLLDWLQKFASNSNERDLEILLGQVAYKGKGFMTELAGKFDLTRQRVSQIALKMEKSFQSSTSVFIPELLNLINPQIPEASSLKQINELIDTTLIGQLSSPATYPKLDAKEQICIATLRASIKAQLQIDTIGHLYVTRALSMLISEVCSLLKSTPDDCLLTPVCEVEELLAVHASDVPLSQVLDLAGAIRHGDYATHSKSRRGLVKALLLDAAEPVEINDIAYAAQTTRNRISSTLSTIDSICRVDRTRYWISARVSNPYTGIANEIEMRIAENDGRYDRRDLVRELPELFGVSPFSVEAYLQSPRFEVHGNTVFLRDPDSIELRELANVVDGFDPEGNPYWGFCAEDAHFSGYGISGVPPEFAVALGCPINGIISIPILNNQKPDSFATVSWRLATITGAYIGNFSDHLRSIEIKPGDRARVIKREPGLEIIREQDATQ